MDSKVLTNSGFIDNMSGSRRLKEILEERSETDKSAWTIAAFALRVSSISESTLYRIVNEQRVLKPKEKATITEALNISTARFDMTDISKRLLAVQAHVEFKVNLPYASETALELMPLALGYTEKFVILNNIAAIHYHQQKYLQAMGTWTDALAHAEKIMSLFGECEPLFMAVSNLILCYTEVKDYYSIAKMLRSIEARFDVLPPRFSASVAYSLAINALELGDLQTYEEKMLEQFEHFRKVSGDRIHAKALANVAVMFYKVGKNFESVSKFEELTEFLSKSVELSKQEIRFEMYKDYAKALVRVGRKQEAIDLIQKLIVELQHTTYTNTKVKLMLLHTIYTRNIQGALDVLEIKEASLEHKLLAIQILMKESAKANDYEGLMRYYEIGERIQSPSDSEMEDKL